MRDVGTGAPVLNAGTLASINGPLMNATVKLPSPDLPPALILKLPTAVATILGRPPTDPGPILNETDSIVLPGGAALASICLPSGSKHGDAFALSSPAV